MTDTSPVHVLLVDDDDAMREALAMRIEHAGYRVSTAKDGLEALSAIESDRPDVVVTDIVLPGISGLDLLERVTARESPPQFILITAHGSVGWAVDAMKRGAMDFLTKPVDHEHLESLIRSAAEEIERRGGSRALAAELDDEANVVGSMVGRSSAMREVMEQVALLGRNEASGIIWGESGVGKEMVARSIHELSARSDGPFVAVNTAAIPEGLIESEIFGHEKGAFTGATDRRPGCFEQADGGTLLLDEIGDMPLALQPRFLRILEERKTRRLGGSKEVSFDVRVLAATNRPIEKLVEEKILREDLFYRLNVFSILVPPLRDHPEDIPLLFAHFVTQFNEKHGTEVEGLTSEAQEMLTSYRWPGNVRELRNVVERSTILAREGWVRPDHLPPYVRSADGSHGRVVLPIGITAAEAERRLILETLEAVDGNRSEAARRLDLDPKTIYNKLKAWEAEGKTADGGDASDPGPKESTTA
ncbi:MAG: sigma-54 dependent transcriptional regulator [Gemmatimonadota bacterium]|nr:sigma-54 dependent transcriptional regulator [Gemmatimonadota bacterium]